MPDFDPSQPFTLVDQEDQPQFDPSQPFEAVDSERSIKRAGLQDELKRARKQGNWLNLLVGAAGVAEGAGNVISQMNPLTALPRAAYAADQALGLIPKEQENPMDATRQLASIDRLTPEEFESVTGIGGKPAQIVAGIEQAAAGFGDFFLTPNGLMTFGAGAAPAAARAALGTGFAGHMASGVPEAAERFGEATVEGELVDQVRTGLELGGNILLPAAIASHGISRSPKDIINPLREAELREAAERASLEGGRPLTSEGTPLNPNKHFIDLSEPVFDATKPFEVLPPIGDPSTVNAPIGEARPTPVLTGTPAVEVPLSEGQSKTITGPAEAGRIDAGSAATESTPGTSAMDAQKVAEIPAEPGVSPGPTAPPKKQGPINRALPFDILQAVEHYAGGKLSLTYAQKIDSDFKPEGVLKGIFRRNGGRNLDDVLDGLHREGFFLNIHGEEAFLEALKGVPSARREFRAQGGRERKAQKAELQQTADFEKIAIENKRTPSIGKESDAIPVEELLIGDEFEIAGVKFEVKELVFDEGTQELQHVVVKDGNRFGVQMVDGKQTLHADKGSIVQKEPSTEFVPREPTVEPAQPEAGPKLRRGENQGDVFANQTEPFNLAGEKGVDFERQQRERETAAQSKASADAANVAAHGDMFASPPPTTPGGALGERTVPRPEDNPKYSLFDAMPVELPEAIKFARDLLGGLYPKVRERLGALGGRAAGVFRHGRGEGAKGEIRLRADIADLLTRAEKEKLLEQAHEYARTNAEPRDQARMARERYEHLLKEAYEDAKTRNPAWALKVVWHEIWHAIDWLPQKMIEGRGNLFGRIASLKNFTKHVLPLDPRRPSGEKPSPKDLDKLREEAARQMREELGPIREIISRILVEEPLYRITGIKPEDVKALFGLSGREDMPELYLWFTKQPDAVRVEIAKKAMKGVLDERLAALGKKTKTGTRKVWQTKREVQGREPTPAEIAERFRQLFREELERRNIAELKQVKAELEPLIAWWRGTEKIEDYFKGAVEMYAEAGSILMNNPAAVLKRAPTYYRLIFNHFESKPEAAKLYAEIKDQIKSGQVMGERVRDLRASWRRDAAASMQKIRDRAQGTVRDFLDNVSYHIDRRFGPIYRAARGTESEARVREAVGNFLYRASEHELFLNRVNREVGYNLVKHNLDWNDLGEFMFHQRIIQERFNIFNPMGWTSKNSIERLREMRTDLGETNWQALVQAQKDFRTVYDTQVVPLLKEARLFTPELQKLIESNIWYATFSAVKEGGASTTRIEKLLEATVGSNVGPHIFRQIGMVGEVKQPATATVLKALSLISAAHRNIAKRETVQMLLAHGRENIAEAQTHWTGKRQEPKIVQTEKVGTIVYMEDGKVRAYHVPRTMAEALNFGNAIENRLYSGYLQATGWLKGLYTQLNYGFWPINFARDTQSFWQNMPGATAPIGWVKHLPAAVAAARATVTGRKRNPVADAFLARRMAISRADQKGVWDAVDNEYDLKVASYGLEPAQWDKQAKGASLAVKLWQTYRQAGQTAERVNKIAGMLYLDAKFPNMPEWKKAEIVRERAGSPDFLQRGASSPAVDLFMMFYNPWKEAIRSTTKAARENPYSYTAKLTGLILAPSMLQAAVVSGLLGEDTKKKYRSIPDYDLTNYLVVPIGWSDEAQGKVAYFRFPLPEPARIAHGLLFKTLTGRGEGYAAYMGGQVPTANAMLGVLGAWMQWGIAGKNPYDYFRGKNLISDTAFTAGGTAAAGELGKWTWNQLGGSILHRFQNTQLESPPEGDIEEFLSAPGVNNVLGRWIKVSNRGIDDADRRLTGPIDQQRAQIRLGVDEVMRKLVAQEALTDSERVLLREPYAVEHLLRKLPEVMLGRESNLLRRLNQAKSRPEKTAILVDEIGR